MEYTIENSYRFINSAFNGLRHAQKDKTENTKIKLNKWFFSIQIESKSVSYFIFLCFQIPGNLYANCTLMVCRLFFFFHPFPVSDELHTKPTPLFCLFFLFIYTYNIWPLAYNSMPLSGVFCSFSCLKSSSLPCLGHISLPNRPSYCCLLVFSIFVVFLAAPFALDAIWLSLSTTKIINSGFGCLPKFLAA